MPNSSVLKIQLTTNHDYTTTITASNLADLSNKNLAPEIHLNKLSLDQESYIDMGDHVFTT
jgi:hypothetical protein